MKFRLNALAFFISLALVQNSSALELDATESGYESSSDETFSGITVNNGNEVSLSGPNITINRKDAFNGQLDVIRVGDGTATEINSLVLGSSQTQFVNVAIDNSAGAGMTNGIISQKNGHIEINGENFVMSVVGADSPDENNVSIKLVKYLGTNKMDLVENQEYGYRCIITATQRILDRLDAENTIYAKIEYKGRKEVEMIDKAALKEAVINAVVHNDYSYGNSPIVELYSDRIEITSAGGLPQELSQEEFLEGVTAPRNKELIRVFKDVDLIENIGSGVLRILDAYDKSCFKFMEHFLRVTFKYRENPFKYNSKNNVSADDTLNDTIKDYYFISEEQFKKLIKDKQLYEYVDSDFGPKYGTPKAPVEELLKQGKDVILDLDYPGVQSLKAIAGDRVKAIALLPPSMRVLKERLVNRGTDADEVIERRMSMAEKRIRESQFYDYVIMNDDLDKAADEAISIIKSTRVERKNICELEELINQIVEDK